MTIKKINSILFSGLLVGLFSQFFIFTSCTGGNTQKEQARAQTYDGVSIEVNISKINTLDILLAKDGTINRKGSGVVDTLDKDFFMGMTNEKLFDSLMTGISNDLLAYCNNTTSKCDTTKQICKIKIAFGNSNYACEIDYCVNGELSSLPKPIKEFIEKAITVTDSWYQQQKKMLHIKHTS